MRTRLVPVLAAAALVLPAAGCYRSVPIAGTTPTPRARVELQLTDRGAADLGPRIGNSVDRVQGTVVEANDSTITLALSSTTDRRGIDQSWTGEVVAFHRDHVARVSERRLSRSRSWLLAAGILAMAIAVSGFSGAFGGDERGSEGGTQ